MPAVMSRKLFLLCFAVTVGLILTNLPGSSAGACCCPPMWTAFQGTCYRYFSGQRLTWQEAETQCQLFTTQCWDKNATTSQLGHLVSIHSQAEMDFLIALFESVRNKRVTGRQMVWIGLNDLATEGTFVWSDGSDVDYTPWHTDQPNDYGNAQDCVEFGVEYTYKWNDLRCDPIDVWIVDDYVCKMG
ncbi:echinoidin-like [Diadema setosum]|uniref:echinoidin-like n=1 Tax=Diadema setosum TaxID=31175 RepID=UPI003B3A8C45